MQRFKNGLGNIASNFCKGTFVNTFPKISLSRIIHHERHAPHLQSMVSEMNSRSQAAKIEHNLTPVHAFEGLKSSDYERTKKLKKRSLKPSNNSAALVYSPILKIGSIQRLDHQSCSQGPLAKRSQSSETRTRLSLYQ